MAQYEAPSPRSKGTTKPPPEKSVILPDNSHKNEAGIHHFKSTLPPDAVFNADKVKQMMTIRESRLVKEAEEEIDTIMGEFKAELLKKNITISFIVDQLKDLIENADKSMTRLMALKTVMASLGIDAPREVITTKSWETFMDGVAQGKEGYQKAERNYKFKQKQTVTGTYEVNKPHMPHEERVRRQEEGEIAHSIYGET